MKKSWRIVIVVGLAVVLAVVLLKNLGEEKRMLAVIREARPGWLLVALVFQFFYYWLYSWMWQLALAQYGLNWRIKEILLLTFGSLFINLTAPTAGLAGAGVFIRHARSKKERALPAMAAYYLGILMEFLGIALCLVITFLILLRKQDLTWYELTAGGVFLLITLGLFLLVVSSAKWRQIVARLMRKRLIPGEVKFARPLKRLWQLFLLGIVMQLTNLASLFFVFLALGQTVLPLTIFVGFFLTVLFLIVAPTPQGIGVVETLIPVILSGFGVGIETGLWAILLFRLLNLWLPFLAGFFSLNYLTVLK